MMVKQKNNLKKKKYKGAHWQLVSMSLPAMLLLFIFAYIPMFGIVVAFKNLKFSLGIWGSPWNGFENFEFLFRSDSLAILLRNTVCYNIIGIILGNAVPIVLALALERIKRKTAIKVYQTSMFLPYFLSWIVVSYFSFALFEYDTGIINKVIAMLGGERINFYNTPGVWPFILILFALWKGLGYNTLIYYGSLLSVDPSLYEAAIIDGCGYFKRVWHISLPHLVPSVIVLFLLSLGGIFRSDYGLYYFIPKDTGALLDVTDVFDTYIFRTLRNATNLGLSSAIAFLQSVVGLVFVVAGNSIARKIDKDVALF